MHLHTAYPIGIDLTRMECKEEEYRKELFAKACIDLTRMECKVRIVLTKVFSQCV